MLLVLHFKSGQSSHKHQDENHYNGQQHNPEHDMNVLLGDEVCSYIQHCIINIPTHAPPFIITFIAALHGFYPQDTGEIKNLSPAEQKVKIMEIIKKIDTNADKLLNAGEVTLHYLKTANVEVNLGFSLLYFLYRGADCMDSTRVQKICYG